MIIQPFLFFASVCLGRSGLAWLACGPHLEVVHAMTGERLSAYCFSSAGEHPPTVLAARDFSWLKRLDFCSCFPFLCSIQTVVAENKLLLSHSRLHGSRLSHGCLRLLCDICGEKKHNLNLNSVAFFLFQVWIVGWPGGDRGQCVVSL